MVGYYCKINEEEEEIEWKGVTEASFTETICILSPSSDSGQ